MNKVPVPVFRQTAPTDVVDIDADTLEDLKNRSGQAQLARAGIQALGSVLGSGAGYAMTKSMKGGMAPALLNIGAGGIVGRTAATPVANAVANRMMIGHAQRYRDEIKSQLNDREQLDEFAPFLIAIPILGTVTVPGWVTAAAAGVLSSLGIFLGKEYISNNKTLDIAYLLNDELADISTEQILKIGQGYDVFSKTGEFVGDNTVISSDLYKHYKPIIDERMVPYKSNLSGMTLGKVYGGFPGLVGRGKMDPRSYTRTQAPTTPYVPQTQTPTQTQTKELIKHIVISGKTAKKLAVYSTISIAALLAAGFTVSQASKVIRKMRANLKASKASIDIVKLASIGDTKGAQLLMDKEFKKAANVNMEALANATEGLSKKEIKMAAQILKRELT